ncbi:LPXTG cell wall anchor domain-containing protein [Flavobacterium pectinovorum]|uniref:LPXTG cell wall anchor domain-containing protein n=1 Tax=Flavobacterium pectinovorum TaxID=29533 RepID=A0A502EKK0_9FLAO|nr:LPXTG cell wall anchor domain-containing protein [Flavobacterium pectinovorum]
MHEASIKSKKTGTNLNVFIYLGILMFLFLSVLRLRYQ